MRNLLKALAALVFSTALFAGLGAAVGGFERDLSIVASHVEPTLIASRERAVSSVRF